MLSFSSIGQLNIRLVRGIQRHLQFSDGDCHLLLDLLHFILQFSLSFVQPGGQGFNFYNHLLPDASKLILLVLHVDIIRLGHLLELQFKFLNSLLKLDLESISVLVSSSQFFSVMSQFPVLHLNLMESLLQGIIFSLERLQFIFQLGPVPLETFIVHLGTIQLIAKLDNVLGTSFAVLV